MLVVFRILFIFNRMRVGGLTNKFRFVGRLTRTLWRISAYQGAYAFKRVLTYLYVTRNRYPNMRSKYPPLVPVEGIGGDASW